MPFLGILVRATLEALHHCHGDQQPQEPRPWPGSPTLKWTVAVGCAVGCAVSTLAMLAARALRAGEAGEGEGINGSPD